MDKERIARAYKALGQKVPGRVNRLSSLETKCLLKALDRKLGGGSTVQIPYLTLGEKMLILVAKHTSVLEKVFLPK